MNDQLIDSLPYTDSGFTEEAKLDALRLIEEECKVFRQPSSYYEERLPKPSWKEYQTPFIDAEEERRASGLKLNVVRSMKDYSTTKPPAYSVRNPRIWKDAIEKEQLRYEYNLQQINFYENIYDFNSEAWLEANKESEKHLEFLKKIESDTCESTTKINSVRKTDQLNAGAILSDLDRDWANYMAKNYDLENAILDIDGQTKELKKKLEFFEMKKIRNATVSGISSVPN